MFQFTRQYKQLQLRLRSKYSNCSLDVHKTLQLASASQYTNVLAVSVNFSIAAAILNQTPIHLLYTRSDRSTSLIFI